MRGGGWLACNTGFAKPYLETPNKSINLDLFFTPQLKN
jgi:hypothetical protein